MQHTNFTPIGQSSARSHSTQRPGRRLKPRTPPPPYSWTQDEDYSAIPEGDDGWCEHDIDGDAVGCDGVIDDEDSQSEDELA